MKNFDQHQSYQSKSSVCIVVRFKGLIGIHVQFQWLVFGVNSDEDRVISTKQNFQVLLSV